MRVPYSWLREAVQAGAPGWDVSPEELEAAFIRIGHEVEDVIAAGPVTGPLTVGRVVEIEELTEFKKPIRACKVDVGEAQPRDIVCGARNFAVGDLVAGGLEHLGNLLVVVVATSILEARSDQSKGGRSPSFRVLAVQVVVKGVLGLSNQLRISQPLAGVKFGGITIDDGAPRVGADHVLVYGTVRVGTTPHVSRSGFTDDSRPLPCGREDTMDRDALMKFVGTGMIVLPVILAIGTASLDAVAMSLFALLILQLAVLVIRPDDPIGDKMRADAEKDDPPPPR